MGGRKKKRKKEKMAGSRLQPISETEFHPQLACKTEVPTISNLVEIMEEQLHY